MPLELEEKINPMSEIKRGDIKIGDRSKIKQIDRRHSQRDINEIRYSSPWHQGSLGKWSGR